MCSVRSQQHNPKNHALNTHVTPALPAPCVKLFQLNLQIHTHHPGRPCKGQHNLQCQACMQSGVPMYTSHTAHLRHMYTYIHKSVTMNGHHPHKPSTHTAQPVNSIASSDAVLAPLSDRAGRDHLHSIAHHHHLALYAAVAAAAAPFS